MIKTSTGMNRGKGTGDLIGGCCCNRSSEERETSSAARLPAYAMSRLLVMLGLLVTALCQKKTPCSAARGFERA